MLGIQVLSKAQTAEVLGPFGAAVYPPNKILLPAVANLSNPAQMVFMASEAITDPAHVWIVTQPVRQLPYGSVVVGKQLLCVNFGNQHWLENGLAALRRKAYTAQTVLVPWSHYVDGISYGGYYDFLLLVAAQLCRIKDTLPAADFREATVAYPLFDTAYERDVWALLGIDAGHVVDSRRYAVRAERVVLGDNGHWFYPNLADILSLKKHVESRLQVQQTARNRLYISRVGRRRVVNEEELIEMLKSHQFIIIDDKPRTVAEQVVLYKNASVILGPHGASFSNVIWCEPGTHLIELFSSKYMPPHFLYLATVMQMRYSAYYQGEQEHNQHAALEGDMYVSVQELEPLLVSLLAE